MALIVPGFPILNGIWIDRLPEISSSGQNIIVMLNAPWALNMECVATNLALTNTPDLAKVKDAQIGHAMDQRQLQPNQRDKMALNFCSSCTHRYSISMIAENLQSLAEGSYLTRSHHIPNDLALL